jgi:hypothetical protein
MPKEFSVSQEKILKAIAAGKGISFNDHKSAEEYASNWARVGYQCLIISIERPKKWIVVKYAKYENGEFKDILDLGDD